jgi:glycolate dehydrogenase FAD-binding subunit
MATAILQDVAKGLGAIVGEAAMHADAAFCAAFAVDGLVPGCAVIPANAQQVADTLRFAADNHQAVIPCGQGTKLGIGNPPRSYNVALSLRNMTGLNHYEPADLTVSVEPGMLLGEFQALLAKDGLWLPLDPAGGARASIGGILAANASGPLRGQYGGPRDVAIGMKIATTEGKIIKSGGRVVKNVAGYDMAKLLIGSLGTLGVIVEASFKLSPLPKQRLTFLLRAGTLGIARHLRRQLLQSAVQPARLALLNGLAARHFRAGTPLAGDSNETELWIEMHGSAITAARFLQELAAMAREAGAAFDVVEQTEFVDTLWARVADPAGTFGGDFPEQLICKASLPVSAGEEFISAALQEIEGTGCKGACVGLAALGLVRVCILNKGKADEKAALVHLLRRQAMALKGALVVERCPAALKPRVDVWGPGDDNAAFMRTIKSVWDPANVLAPGRFIAGI